ncbi:unnamed protein product [Amoebophrya sp. A120]|nr:unnamed protein product [Amoebophrya sp. A120]|eukprot:GSA120T00000993001.1
MTDLVALEPTSMGRGPPAHHDYAPTRKETYVRGLLEGTDVVPGLQSGEPVWTKSNVYEQLTTHAGKAVPRLDSKKMKQDKQGKEKDHDDDVISDSEDQEQEVSPEQNNIDGESNRFSSYQVRSSPAVGAKLPLTHGSLGRLLEQDVLAGQETEPLRKELQPLWNRVYSAEHVDYLGLYPLMRRGLPRILAFAVPRFTMDLGDWIWRAAGLLPQSCSMEKDFPTLNWQDYSQDATAPGGGPQTSGSTSGEPGEREHDAQTEEFYRDCAMWGTASEDVFLQDIAGYFVHPTPSGRLATNGLDRGKPGLVAAGKENDDFRLDEEEDYDLPLEKQPVFGRLHDHDRYYKSEDQKSSQEEASYDAKKRNKIERVPSGLVALAQSLQAAQNSGTGAVATVVLPTVRNPEAGLSPDGTGGSVQFTLAYLGVTEVWAREVWVTMIEPMLRPEVVGRWSLEYRDWQEGVHLVEHCHQLAKYIAIAHRIDRIARREKAERDRKNNTEEGAGGGNNKDQDEDWLHKSWAATQHAFQGGWRLVRRKATWLASEAEKAAVGAEEYRNRHDPFYLFDGASTSAKVLRQVLGTKAATRQREVCHKLYVKKGDVLQVYREGDPATHWRGFPSWVIERKLGCEHFPHLLWRKAPYEASLGHVPPWCAHLLDHLVRYVVRKKVADVQHHNRKFSSRYPSFLMKRHMNPFDLNYRRDLSSTQQLSAAGRRAEEMDARAGHSLQTLDVAGKESYTQIHVPDCSRAAPFRDHTALAHSDDGCVETKYSILRATKHNVALALMWVAWFRIAYGGVKHYEEEPSFVGDDGQRYRIVARSKKKKNKKNENDVEDHQHEEMKSIKNAAFLQEERISTKAILLNRNATEYKRRNRADAAAARRARAEARKAAAKKKTLELSNFLHHNFADAGPHSVIGAYVKVMHDRLDFLLKQEESTFGTNKKRPLEIYAKLSSSISHVTGKDFAAISLLSLLRNSVVALHDYTPLGAYLRYVQSAANAFQWEHVTTGLWERRQEELATLKRVRSGTWHRLSPMVTDDDITWGLAEAELKEIHRPSRNKPFLRKNLWKNKNYRNNAGPSAPNYGDESEADVGHSSTASSLLFSLDGLPSRVIEQRLVHLIERALHFPAALAVDVAAADSPDDVIDFLSTWKTLTPEEEDWVLSREDKKLLLGKEDTGKATASTRHLHDAATKAKLQRAQSAAGQNQRERWSVLHLGAKHVYERWLPHIVTLFRGKIEAHTRKENKKQEKDHDRGEADGTTTVGRHKNQNASREEQDRKPEQNFYEAEYGRRKKLLDQADEASRSRWEFFRSYGDEKAEEEMHRLLLLGDPSEHAAHDHGGTSYYMMKNSVPYDRRSSPGPAATMNNRRNSNQHLHDHAEDVEVDDVDVVTSPRPGSSFSEVPDRDDQGHYDDDLEDNFSVPPAVGYEFEVEEHIIDEVMPEEGTTTNDLLRRSQLDRLSSRTAEHSTSTSPSLFSGEDEVVEV